MKPEQRAALRRIDRQFDAVRSMPEPIPARERYRYGIEQVGLGSYFRIGGELQKVVSTSHYEEKGSRWQELELFGLESGTQTYVEWEKDDEIEISLNGVELTLAAIGVTADEVEEMSDEEEGKISYDGRTYHYDDDYGATYHRDGTAGGEGKGAGKGEKVYFYDFETSDECFVLTVEEWGDEASGYEYQVFLSEYIEPDAVEVLSIDGSGGS